MFATGALRGLATGDTKDGKIGVKTREWCGSGYALVTRYHEESRVYKNEESAISVEVDQLVKLMSCFDLSTVEKAYKKAINQKRKPDYDNA